MLFTTAAFAFVFLPIALLGFFALGHWTGRGAAFWLFLCSVVFYGYWMPEFTLLLLASIALNFFIGRRITTALTGHASAARLWLVAGLALNLALLAYFKYTNFLLDNLALAMGARNEFERVILPIGISFYTFTQIAFLVDAYRHKVHETDPVHYGLFVTYFPHLIAGPVLHHAQMMPQFADRTIYRFDAGNFVAGLVIFGIGLAKKVVLADGISPYADAVFAPVDAGAAPGTQEAWLAAIAYTLQLYFDFSGYSDMAIGLSWMFNIRLPFNFDSPYRATSISEFWRRWHISLSTFLRDYLYIALGGNRKGVARRHVNLMTTMLLGGLWHGAGWSFLFWGGLHGAYLIANHAWRAAVGERLGATLDRSRAFKVAGWALTVLAVVVAWVFFRAQTFGGAWRMLMAMGGAPAAADPGQLLWNAGLAAPAGMWWCVVLAAIALSPVNSNRIGERVRAAAHRASRHNALLGGGALCAAMLLVVVNTARDSVSAFIYFNF